MKIAGGPERPAGDHDSRGRGDPEQPRERVPGVGPGVAGRGPLTSQTMIRA
jgi:hypothetical protein